MLPHPLSRSAPGAKNPPLPDLAHLLEQHAAAGFPPDLALDLVLNELVVRAADAAQATAAALALLRNDQMVCRAATGRHAPDLGTPLETRNGLSGACVRTRAPQLCADTESDPRIDPIISRRLGIRSMLVVPVFDHETIGPDQRPPLTGVLEVFSPLPDTFTPQAQILLVDFADECARIVRLAANLKTRPPAEVIQLDEGPSPDEEDVQLAQGGTSAPPAQAQAQSAFLFAHAAHAEEEDHKNENQNDDYENRNIYVEEARHAAEQNAESNSVGSYLFPPSSEEPAPPAAHARQPYETWTLILGALVILAAAAFSFMIGSRIGWLRSSPTSTSQIQLEETPAQPAASASPPSTAPSNELTQDSPKSKSTSRAANSPGKPPQSSSDELVVYDKDKVVFRMKPTPAGPQGSPVESASKSSGKTPGSAASVARSSSLSTKTEAPSAIWLAPEQAESRLLTRVEPQYPADAIPDHRSGDVTLEVHVSEDGTVSSIRPLNGDPILAAAAMQAVRNWRYEPYRDKHQPAKFQTDVTLSFSPTN